MFLSGSDARSSKWQSYGSVAENLILQGFYNGLFEVIADCWKAGNKENKQVFIVIDAPSGSGKTLFGIALFLMDRDRTGLGGDLSQKRKELISKGIDLKVVYCIWPAAMSGQSIYEDIISEQSDIAPNMIYHRSKYLNMELVLNKNRSDKDLERHVWCQVLQYVFETDQSQIVKIEEKFVVAEFLVKKKLNGRYIFIYADEVPFKPSELNVIYNLREATKRISCVGIALAGTNSKAANMIGLSEATSIGLSEAASSDIDMKPWALFVTRLPSFQLELSDMRDTWQHAK